MENLNKFEHEVIIKDQQVELRGILALPRDCQSIIIFAHGSGSGRLSPRNNFVAQELQQGNLGTLLLDLLTEEEALDRGNVFDIPLLARRLIIAKQWIELQTRSQAIKIGYFGASTGAGAALMAASDEPDNIYAIVSRGGRPDLANEKLNTVKAPTLLLVGGEDNVVIELNKEALDQLNCIKKLVIIPSATHLFEEPGTLEKVAELARDWFLKYN